MQETQIDNSPIEKKTFTSGEFSMLTLMKEIKRVVLVNYWFEYREKLKIKCFFGIFGLPGFSAREKNNDFLVDYPCKGAVFLIENLIDEIEVVQVEN